jgi:hypothetical protein
MCIIFLLLVSIKNEVYSTNVDTRDKLRSRIFDVAIRTNKREVQRDNKQAIFIHKLQIPLRLKVVFPKIYLKQICRIMCKKFAI